MTRDPALWGFFGIVFAGLITIVTEQVRNTRKTQNVLTTVEDLRDDIAKVTERLDQHINWHLTSRSPIYLRGKRHED